MRKAELGNVAESAAEKAEAILARLAAVEGLGEVIRSSRERIQQAESELTREASVWMPPKGHVWSVTSLSNRFGFVKPTVARWEEGFETEPEMREFTPPQPDDRYVFVAGLLHTKTQISAEPGVIYAEGCFSPERIKVEGDDYEIGVVTTDNLPNLLANTPLDSGPEHSIHRVYGVVRGGSLVIEPNSLAA